MEDLQKKHRQEQKDIQARIIQKRKSATKKTRKGVNDECAELERQLEDRQADELASLHPNLNAVEDDLGGTVSDAADGNTDTIDLNEDGLPLQALSLSSTTSTNSQPRKPNRQKARLARRIAEQEAKIEQAEKEAANLPNKREQEILSMREAYSAMNLKQHDVRSDGHCMYAAVADQLCDAGLSLKPNIKMQFDDTKLAAYMVTRQVAATYISQNPGDFEPFLELPLEEYVNTVRETGEWGGHLEILALAKAYQVNINILHGNGQVNMIESGVLNARGPLWLAYYRHSYGLGEHYNSLRRNG